MKAGKVGTGWVRCVGGRSPDDLKGGEKVGVLQQGDVRLCKRQQSMTTRM